MWYLHGGKCEIKEDIQMNRVNVIMIGVKLLS